MATRSITKLAEQLGLLRRRRAALHSRLHSLCDESFDSSQGQAALSREDRADMMQDASDEISEVELEISLMEEQYRSLEWQQPGETK